MKKGLALLSMLFVMTLVVFPTGCNKDVETKDFDFKDFNEINISSAYKVEIIKDDIYSISITTDSDKLEYIEVTKVNNKLSIGIESHSTPINFNTLEAKITLPDINILNISGAVKAEMKGFSFNHDFQAIVSGASNLSGELEAGNVNFNIDGASTLQLSGSGEDIIANFSGASTINLSGFSLNNADIVMSSASDATIKLNGTLDANLSGASKLTYKGNPSLGNINTSSSSTISKG